ncbi:MAG: DUF2807 domain-containing protein [Coxiellaceae bacterium]|nr:MAG: DUF2807 domain-containing protein [Coxiellaceae bacterium]
MQGNYRVAVTAPEAYAQAVVIQNNDGVLSLQRDKSIDQFPDEPISVNIWLPYLRELDLFHGAVAAVQGASGSNIRLVLNDQSRISLQGYVPVAEVDVAGDSMVDVSWVDTDHIQIIGRDNSEIHLAGAVRVLDARLYDNAVLDAKYLRSITALVYTCENAMAQVIATYSLNAFATDFSNIYYYRTPEKLVDFSEKSGNVLQVAHWN